VREVIAAPAVWRVVRVGCMKFAMRL